MGETDRVLREDAVKESSLVILESPFAGKSRFWIFRKLETWLNVRYARACVRHSLFQGEAPIASHLLYTQNGILEDCLSEDRKTGIDAGLAWKRVADYSVVYTDRGISAGMRYGIISAENARIPVVYRSIYKRD
jgi:hypothetical protein